MKLHVAKEILSLLDAGGTFAATGTYEIRNNQTRLHRLDGPAVIYANGRMLWYHDGFLHREDGPAIISHDGNTEWHVNGRLHREGGSAVIWSDGVKEWWFNGIYQGHKAP